MTSLFRTDGHPEVPIKKELLILFAHVASTAWTQLSACIGPMPAIKTTSEQKHQRDSMVIPSSNSLST
jgi:hypothetical protein